MVEQDELKLVIEGKDRDWFQSRSLPFPKYWYGYGKLPQSRKKNRAYSTEMRALSDMSLEQLEVIEMFWGISPLVVDKLKLVDPEFIENISVPTPTRINALLQVKLSLINPEERKEWADRVEGKAVSREVSMSLVTEDSESTTGATREFITSKFDELGDMWKEYGKNSKGNELDHTEFLQLGNGETER